MNAWKEDQESENVTVIPDGNGDFTRGMGMLVSKNDLGFWRAFLALFYVCCKRYS